MTKTRIILMAMIADGQPRSHAALREEFDLTSSQASTILRALVKGGYLGLAPVTYSLTDVGRRHVDARTEEHAARLVKKAEYMARKRARSRGEQVVSARASTQTIVSRAMKSRPALDMAWMRSPESAGLGGRGEAA